MLTINPQAMLSISIQVINRWIPIPFRRKPSLGKLFAESDKVRLGKRLPDLQGWSVVRRLFAGDSRTEDTTVSRERTGQRHLYLALGALGFSAVGVSGVPLLGLVTIPVQIYFVARFVQHGIRQIVWQRQVGMAVIDALVTGLLLGLGYFWAISLYAACFYGSRSLLQQIRQRYQERMHRIARTSLQRVRVMRNANEAWVALDTLRVDDIIVVYAGEVVPVDGVVVGGLACIDQCFLNGAVPPVKREAGQPVLAMTLVLTGTLLIRADQTGTGMVSAQTETFLRDMHIATVALIRQAEAVSNRYAVPLLLLGGGTVLLLSPLSGLAVLCAYPGAALRITRPLTTFNYLQLAAQCQILLKDGQILELLHTVDTVMFDTTGTLTQDQPRVVNIYAYVNYTEDDVLALAAIAEQHHPAPLTRTLRQTALERQLALPVPTAVHYEPEVGVEIVLDNLVVHVVNGGFLERTGISLPITAEAIQAYCYQRGHSLVYVLQGDTVIGMIELAVALRSEALQVVAHLQQQGKTVWIVSSDHEQPTRWLAQTLQIDAYQSAMLPADNAALIARLQAEGKTVCFVGGGTNDVLAWKQANVAVALHNAPGVVFDPVQIMVPDRDLLRLLMLFDLAQRMHTQMQGNLVSSIVPGVITIAGVYLFSFGIVAACVVYTAGLAGGIANAMLPLVLPYRQQDNP